MLKPLIYLLNMNIYFAIVVVLALVGIFFLLLKRTSVMKRLALDTAIGGIIYGGLMAVYSILLAFVVVVVWQQYQNTGDRVEIEAAKVFNLYRSSYAFPDTVGRSVRLAVVDYATSVCNDEWPALGHDSLSTVTQTKYNHMWAVVYNIKPSTPSEQIWYTSMVQSINQFGEARIMRISDVDSSIPAIMWQMLIGGALVILLFTILFSTENDWVHLLKVIMFSTVIIFSLALVYMLDHPFKGVLKVDPTAFQKILTHYQMEQK
jgi:hypothetical protein